VQLYFGPLIHYTQIESITAQTIWVSRHEAEATKLSVAVNIAWLDDLLRLLEASRQADLPPDPSPPQA